MNPQKGGLAQVPWRLSDVFSIESLKLVRSKIMSLFLNFQKVIAVEKRLIVISCLTFRQVVSALFSVFFGSFNKSVTEEKFHLFSALN